MKSDSSNSSNSFAQLLLLGALWGASFMFMRVAVPEFGALSMAATRVFLASVIMLIIVLLLRQSLEFRTRWKTYLAIGAVNTTIPFVAYSFAALHIPAGYSAIANSTTPVWGALIAWLWFKEKLGIGKWVGVVCAFAGVLVLVGLQPVALTPMVLAGIVAAVAAAAVYATASFLIKRYLTGDSGFAGAISQFASASGMVWGAAMWLLLPGLFFAPTVMPSVKAWASILALSVFCTVAGYALFFHLIKTIGPQRASSVAFLFPVFAAFWGWLILSEPITPNMIAGMAFVLVGTALVSGSKQPVGVASNAEKWRDWIFWPLLFALGPQSLRRWIASRYQRSEAYFREEVAALRGNLPNVLPNADVEAAAREQRLLRLTDRADVFMSTLLMRQTLARDIRVIALPPVDEAALILSAHRGNGWWTLSSLNAQGKPVELVSAPFPAFRGWQQWLWWPYVRLRWREMNRMGGMPLITMRGASRHVKTALSNGGRVIATIDIPPVLAKRCAPVPFFGRTAWMPRQAIDIALESGASVWMFFGDVDAATLQQIIRFEKLDTSRGAEATFAEYTAKLEAAIRARPGSWHAWGDFELYFQTPAHLAPTEHG